MLEETISGHPAARPWVRAGSPPEPRSLKRHGPVMPREPLNITLVRHASAMAWALRPKHIGAVSKTIGLLIHHHLTPAMARRLPDPERTRPGTSGLCGIVGDTSVETMMEGMRRGLYAIGGVEPMKWCSPEVRCVLSFPDLKITETLARFLRNGPYRVTFDEDPAGVLAACAAPRKRHPRLTWMTPAMMSAALDLFDAGHMHSVDVWNADGELAGGLYGYAAGRVFVHESSFQRESHASNMALAVLAGHLAGWGFALIDSKYMTARYRALGYRNIPRRELCVHLQEPAPKPAERWRLDPGFDIGNWKPAEGPPRREETASVAAPPGDGANIAPALL